MNGYPNTYQPNPDRDARIQRPQVFDPALKHCFYAFRFGNPIFQDREIATKWLDARQQVIELILQLIQSSRWHEYLVLRGSLLLKVWLGDIAREPGDIDWVFRPEDVNASDLLANQLFDELIQMVAAYPQAGNVWINAAKITTDEIWTYERADGRRIVFPWHAKGLPAGTLQMDVVFGERIPSMPIQTSIPTRSGTDLSIWSVSKELSLAWKLLWLETDSYPQGKDLYDATLLAEQTQLPFELVRPILESSEDWIDRLKHDVPNFSWKSGYPWLTETSSIDWDNFIIEYPWVEGDAPSWLDRLSRALAPTFANLEI
jgi:Nucleotidyl transferase AbiEii toxin, Type IV TA system